jgi:hypothetical protein
MKPFNLEEALAGAKVITGLGKLVTDIAYFPSASGFYKVCAVIDEVILYFTVAGCLFKKRTNSFLDLYMAPVKKEGWINIYKDEKPGECIYKTKEDARASGWTGPIACVRIEWEE